MKYLIGNRVINGDHIVQAVYWPEHGEVKSQCDITLTSVIALELDRCSTSDNVVLRDVQADRFWDAYSGDAYQVTTK